MDEPVGTPGAEPDESERVWQLNQQRLLQWLQRVKAASGLPQLRTELAELHEAIAAGAGPLFELQPATATVVFGAQYLSGELEQIAAALSLERARYYTERLIKAVQEERRAPINDINLNRWKEYDNIWTDSFWQIERRDSSGVHSAGYWGNFIPQIPNQLMHRYTRRGEWVLDPFAGLGTTLIEGQRLGRNTLGVELQPEVAERARELLAREANPAGVVREIVVGDSTQTDFAALLARFGRQSVQLVLLHPPYHDIIRFSEDPRDLSNAESVERFLELLGEVVRGVLPVLDRGRYLALVISDTYRRGDWIPLGFQAMNEVQRHGLSLKSIVVKNFDATTGKRNQKELWRYRALAGGFYVFKHEYLFVFRKP